MAGAEILTFPDMDGLVDVEMEVTDDLGITADVVALSSIRENMGDIRDKHAELVREYTAVGCDSEKRADIRKRLGRLDRILYPEAYS